MKSIAKYILMTALVIPVFAGCTRDHFEETPLTDGTTITFKLNLPGTANPGTRALTENNESEINTVDVLALHQKSNGDWIYDYTATVVSKNVSIVENVATLTVTAKAVASSESQQFVILINASDELAAASPGFKEKIEDIEERLFCTKGGGQWKANITGDSRGSGYDYIPMYARTTAAVVSPTQNNPFGTFQALRMLARIDVSVKSTISTSTFILEEAYLFNYKTKGYVSHFNALTGTGTDTRVTAPVVPSDANSGDPILPGTLRYPAEKTGGQGSIVRSIYTFESTAIAGDADKFKGTALVVGGRYDGASASNLSYYRIDFKPNGSVTENISDGLLRNHLYNIVIDEVSGPGESTPMDAYKNATNRLATTVEAWNVFDQIVIGDKQYYFNVTEDDLSFRYDPQGSQTITASTNYDGSFSEFPAGIVVNTTVEYTPAMTAGNEWLTLNVDGSDGDPSRTITLSAAENTSKVARTAKFSVTAGNFTKIINVTQAMAPTITVSPETLNLPADASSGSFTVTVENDPDATIAWTLESSETWLTLTDKVDGGDAALSFIGTPGNGTTTVRVIADPNLGNSLRTATVSLNNSPAVTVTQEEPLLYVGRFAGELLQDANGVWQFERALYVQGGDASTDVLQWKTERSATDGTVSSIDGRGNTWAMTSTPALRALHPAATLCYNKNGTVERESDLTWYLPASQQTNLVWTVYYGYEAIFQHSQDGYWTSSENALVSTYASGVNFAAGALFLEYKDGKYNVRCVREL